MNNARPGYAVQSVLDEVRHKSLTNAQHDILQVKGVRWIFYQAETLAF